MTDHPRGTDTESRTEQEKKTELLDAKTLRYAVGEAIRTSPNSFLKTLHDVNALDRKKDYWKDEIRTSTWIVAECEGSVVGVAAAKRPDPDRDREDAETTRYIESVWIAPNIRRNGRGQELIRHLLEAECRINPDVRCFLLWVFTTNTSAIRLYRRMGFVQTLEMNEGIKTEVKYRLDFAHLLVNLLACPVASEADGLSDERQPEITYRVLGEKDSE